MKRVLIVGKGFSGLTKWLLEHGYDYLILRDKKTTKKPDKKIARRILCDFTSRQTVLETVNNIPLPIHAVLTVYDNYVLQTAWIAEQLGLPGLPITAAEACTDKFLMRQRFAAAPEPISPAFQLVEGEDSLRAFAQDHDFPLILKPANLSKSLLVTKNKNLAELIANYRKTMEQIGDVYAKYEPLHKPKLLVEEFLAGPSFSVEAFCDASGEPQVLEQVVDYRIGYDIGYDDNFQYSRVIPSKLSVNDVTALRHVAVLGMKALGIKNGVGHVEIIMTKNGPRIIEIGARNGGYRERMHKLANGIDIVAATVSLALGQAPQLEATKHEYCSVLELFPKTPGAFVGIANEAKLKALPSFHSFTVKAKPDEFRGKAADGYKMCAIVVLHHANKHTFEQDLAFVDSEVAVLTQPA